MNSRLRFGTLILIGVVHVPTLGCRDGGQQPPLVEPEAPPNRSQATRPLTPEKIRELLIGKWEVSEKPPSNRSGNLEFTEDGRFVMESLEPDKYIKGGGTFTLEGGKVIVAPQAITGEVEVPRVWEIRHLTERECVLVIKGHETSLRRAADSAASIDPSGLAHLLIGKWTIVRSRGFLPVRGTMEFTGDGKVLVETILGGKRIKLPGTYQFEGNRFFTAPDGRDGVARKLPGQEIAILSSTLFVWGEEDKKIVLQKAATD